MTPYPSKQLYAIKAPHEGKLAKRWERVPGLAVRVETMPKVRLRDAVVVCFEGKVDSGRLEVVLDRGSGELITAHLIPPQASAEAPGSANIKKLVEQLRQNHGGGGRAGT